jgi:mRNA-degrading endonuclease toxin of MazEF toxin-antitoxin module
MLRGQIWLYSADPSIGDEIGKTRPCIIVSSYDLRNSPVINYGLKAQTR